MEVSSSSVNKCFCILGLLAIYGIASVYGAGECPKSTPDAEAMKLLPCASAAQDADAAVPSSCCAQVKKLGQNPKCMCAVLLSDTAKSAGVKPEIALTIPKRCNFADRPVGYKCGGSSAIILNLSLFSLSFLEYNCWMTISSSNVKLFRIKPLIWIGSDTMLNDRSLSSKSLSC